MPRRLYVERLEMRQLLAALPYGAMPDDTAEYMLGDVRVTVVLLESDNTVDNGSITYTLPGATTPVTYGYTPQNWTPTAINSVKARVQEGLNWWTQTLDALPNVRDGLLNFTIDWAYADTPLNTSYEPIARISDDYPLYVNQFISKFQQDNPALTLTTDLMTNIRAINNYQRVDAGADWAFTIFVVNNAPDRPFTQFPGFGSFDKAFAFAGGRFMVIPASRPASTFAHETGHMFWGFDEYLDQDFVWNPSTQQYDQVSLPDEYLKRRGYYNTQNWNAADNPTGGFVHRPSIMSNGPHLDAAYAGHTSAESTLDMIGWKDSDLDGIFDVLDVPIDLTGLGRYDSATGLYRFTGSAVVGTLPNHNPSGLQNDISINQLRVIEVSIDNGPWTAVHTLPPRTYEANLEVSIPVPAGDHTVKLRVADSRTGASSAVFFGNTLQPTSIAPLGVSGFVFRDDDADGVWDANEPPLTDFAIEAFDEFDNPLDLMKSLDPSGDANGPIPESTILNNYHPEVILSAIGSDAQTNLVRARTSPTYVSAGKVFTAQSIQSPLGPTEKWTTRQSPTPEDRRLKAEFPNKTGTVSIRAYSGGGTAFGRLEAYNAQGVLLDRFTSGPISGNTFVTMKVSHPTDDIAYVIVSGHAGTEVILDVLQWGPMTSATTNTLGAYSLVNLPPGTYHIKTDPPPNHIITTPQDGFATVTVNAGQPAGGVNFGITIVSNLWHNLASPLNVNNDELNEITPLDALLVINWINGHPDESLLPDQGDPEESGYVDVNNDGECTPLDALLVINELNLPIDPGDGGEPEGETSAGRGQGDERDQDDQPQSAAEYYAQKPIHFLYIAGADVPCSCSECLGQAASPTGAELPLATLQPKISVVTTQGSEKAATAPAKNRRLHEPETQQRVQLSQLPAFAKKVVTTATGKKARIEEALDAIALDVSAASESAPPPASVRRGRARP